MKLRHVHKTNEKMKNEKRICAILFIIWLLILTANVATAQNVIKDAKGNYTQVAAAKKDTAQKDAKTGKTFTDSKGKVYDLYRGKNGGLYYWKTSKLDIDYKVYIKEN